VVEGFFQVGSWFVLPGFGMGCSADLWETLSSKMVTYQGEIDLNIWIEQCSKGNVSCTLTKNKNTLEQWSTPSVSIGTNLVSIPS
jgi:hypothetical protein